MGHRENELVKLLEKEKMATGIHIVNCKQTVFCETCMEGKMTRLPFLHSMSKSKETLDLLNSDICEPMPSSVTPGGKRYVLTIIDDYSRYCTVYLLSKKGEASTKIQEFVLNCETKFNVTPKAIQTDRGGEYISNKLKDFFKNYGIDHQMTAPYLPQQNGVSERKNRYLTEMTRCMLLDAELPNQYWGEASDCQLHTKSFANSR